MNYNNAIFCFVTQFFRLLNFIISNYLIVSGQGSRNFEKKKNAWLILRFEIIKVMGTEFEHHINIQLFFLKRIED